MKAFLCCLCFALFGVDAQSSGIIFADPNASDVYVYRSSPYTLTVNENLIVAGNITSGPNKLDLAASIAALQRQVSLLQQYQQIANFVPILASGNHQQSLPVWPTMNKLMIDNVIYGNWDATNYQYIVPSTGYYRCAISGALQQTGSTSSYYGFGIMVNSTLTSFWAPVLEPLSWSLSYAYEDIIHATSGSLISFSGTSGASGFIITNNGGIDWYTVKIAIQRVI